MIDTDTNSIDSCKWELIPINDKTCPKDENLEELILKYHDATEEKYNRYITRLADTYTHPARNQETQLGRIFADIFRDNLGLDIMFLASGSLRQKVMKPIVLLRDLTQMFPYHDEIFRVTVTGKQLKHMITYLFREEALDGEHTEFYQFSRDVKVVVSLSERKVLEISYEGNPIPDDKIYRIGLQGFHFKSMKDFFDVSEEEVSENAPCRILSTNAMDVLDENLSRMDLVRCPEDQRWITLP